MLWGGELVLRDGVAAGQVTSAAWGETLGRCAGLAYLWDPDGAPVDARWIGEGSYEVNVGGDVYPVAVSTKPPYDPDGAQDPRLNDSSRPPPTVDGAAGTPGQSPRRKGRSR